MSARFVRSPVPSDPSSRVNGDSPALSAPISESSSSRRDAGAAGADLVGAGRHRRPDHLRRQRQPGAARVAAQQAQRVLLSLIVGDAVVTQRTDSGRDPVHLPAARQVRRQRLTRGVVAGVGLAGQFGDRALTGDQRELARRQRRAIEQHRLWLGHGRGHARLDHRGRHSSDGAPGPRVPGALGHRGPLQPGGSASWRSDCPSGSPVNQIGSSAGSPLAVPDRARLAPQQRHLRERPARVLLVEPDAVVAVFEQQLSAATEVGVDDLDRGGFPIVEC